MGEKSLQHAKIILFYQANYSSSLRDPSQEGHCHTRRKGTQSLPCHAKTGVCKVGNLLPQRLQNPALRAEGAPSIPMEPSNRVKSTGQAAGRPDQYWCNLSFSMPFGGAAAMKASLWVQRVLREKQAPYNGHFILHSPFPVIQSLVLSASITVSMNWSKKDYRVRQGCNKENNLTSELSFVPTAFKGPS